MCKCHPLGHRLRPQRIPASTTFARGFWSTPRANPPPSKMLGLTTTALAVVVWILSLVEDLISKLTYAACKVPEPEESRPKYLFFVFLAILVDSLLWVYGHDVFLLNFASNSVLTASFGFLATHFIQKQHQFALLDRVKRQRKEQDAQKSKIHIYTSPLESRSGWANDPKTLTSFPSFVTSRVLTCMSLLEISVMLITAFYFPKFGGLGIAFCIFGHYITDSLDGALGRFRGEGYIMWGYYADHAFDALYEASCGLAMARLLATESQLLPTYPVLGLANALLMTTVVYFFHHKEWESFQRGLSTQYSNMAGPVPLHYVEWASGCLALSSFFFAVPWLVLCSVVMSCSAIGLVGLFNWHRRHAFGQPMPATH